MTSAIDATKPIQGRPTTASVRANFAAAKAEIESLQTQATGVSNVLSYGAFADGVTDDTAALQAAISTGRAVFLPAGTYLCSTITLYSNTVLVGENQATTIIKLADGTDDDLIYGDGSDALWGGGTTGGIKDWGLINLTLDGNRANNTAGSCVAVYGQLATVRDVYIKNAPEYGMRTEWSAAGGATPGDFGMQSVFEHIVIDTTGLDGWRFGGPHDSICHDVIVVDASQTTDNTSDGILVDSAGNARWTSCHVWSRGNTTAHRYSINIGAGRHEFAACHFEGAKTANVYLAAARQAFHGCRLYATRGANDGDSANVIIRTQGCVLDVTLDAPASGQGKCKGFVLGTASGDFVSGNTIRAYTVSQDSGVVDFTYNDGNERITITGANGSSGTFVVGAPAASDIVDIWVTGTAGGTVRTEQFVTGIAAAGSSITDATALGYQKTQYISSGTGGVKLPAEIAGTTIVIGNNTAGDVSVYPNSVSSQIANLGGGTAITLPARKSAVFSCLTTAQWMVVLGS